MQDIMILEFRLGFRYSGLLCKFKSDNKQTCVKDTIGVPLCYVLMRCCRVIFMQLIDIGVQVSKS